MSSVVHTWTSSATGASIAILSQSVSGMWPGFTAHIVSQNSVTNFITSSLSVIASVELNGTRITCTDVNGDTQEATAKILGERL